MAYGDMNGSGSIIEGEMLVSSIPSNAWTTVSKIHLKAHHTYILTGNFQFSVSDANGLMIARLYTYAVAEYALVRGTMNAGGGVCVTTMIRPTQDMDVELDAYQSSASAKPLYRPRYTAVQLS